MKLEIDSDFWREVVSIGARYDGEREGLGDDFVEAVDHALGQILEQPLAWAVWPGLRQPAHPIRRFVMNFLDTWAQLLDQAQVDQAIQPPLADVIAQRLRSGAREIRKAKNFIG